MYEYIHYFNSNMVRLKVTGHRSKLKIYTYFNSNMVRLKVTITHMFSCVKSYFNSNMVRLKGQNHHKQCRL